MVQKGHDQTYGQVPSDASGLIVLIVLTSTTLADLFTPLRFVDLSSAVRTPLTR